MTKAIRFVVVAMTIAATLITPLSAGAQRQSGQATKSGGKPRIVVLATGSRDTIWTTNTTSASLEDALTQGGRFELITAAQRDALLKEQGFNNSDLVDPKQATKVGKLLSARYIIIGNAIDVSSSKTKVPGKVGGVIGGLTRRNVDPGEVSADVKSTVQIQMIDAETGVIKLSKSYEEKISKDMMAKSRSESDLLQDGYRKAMAAIATKFSQEMGISTPTEGLVVLVRGNRVAIDLGSEHSIQVGQEFEVYSQDDPIRNAAGEVLSYVTVKHARLRIAQVEPKLSWATVIVTYDEDEKADSQPNLSRIKVNAAVKQVK